ncbi:ABC transporter substrate-binding protein [Bifidobacterium pullorum subsp. saeculare]|uniref:peptide ABC transporter substrate-binding protein n=1 Tax=Bifidobacterium pullorum TaxID=78448 RepID=UPI00195D9006|nr:ABC transporter substrate-binding protein [Bifidobacterium pullorum]MBM6706492.1 ABC transporter substrate-binding protein [Bifidobacterium pullorum subsp. saeculare]
MNARWKTLTVMVACGALILPLAACGSSSAGGSDDNIVRVYGCEPQNPLIPTDTNEVCGGNPETLLFSELIGFDAKGNPKNEVADSIEANGDNTEYTIKLKKGWKFTDGTEVKAENFTRAWSYGANAKNAQLGASFFAPIQGFEDLQKDGLKGDEQLSGLTVVDDYTFTVKLNAPSSVFKTMLGYSGYAPLPDSFFDDPKAFGENPVGNGAYKFDSWDHNQSIKLSKNPDYKGSFPAKNDGVWFMVYTDPQPAYADVEAGNLDSMDTVPTSALSTFESDDQVQAVNEPGNVSQSFTFAANQKHFSLDDEGRLRRAAVSMAIDREQIIDKVSNGTNTPATDFTAPLIPGYSESVPGNEVLQYNPDKAKELWEQANQIAPWGDDESFDIAYNADGGGKDIYDAICNSIHNTLGIKSQATPYPTFSEMRDDITDRKITTAFRSGWQPDYPSAYSYLYSLYDSESADGKGSNDGDYKNPEFDALIDKANTESSDDAAKQDYQQAQEILFKDLPAVPLWYANNKGVAAKNVKGFTLTWQGIEDYRNMTKE